MRIRSKIGLVFFLTAFAVQAGPVFQDFNKKNFYTAMASDSVNDINAQLKIVLATSFHEKEAYQGALLMKKAGLLTKASEKLKSFKSGCIKLETAIQNDSTNAEYHFLRLSIQEHAPHTLKYYKDLEKDKRMIEDSFRQLLPEIRKAIIDYSKHSKILRQENLSPNNY